MKMKRREGIKLLAVLQDAVDDLTNTIDKTSAMGHEYNRIDNTLTGARAAISDLIEEVLCELAPYETVAMITKEMTDDGDSSSAESQGQ